MPVTVCSRVFYRTSIDVKWEGVHYDARDFIDVIKGQPINKYYKVPHNGKLYRFNGGNAAIAVKYLGLWVRATLQRFGIDKATIIPIPNKAAIISSNDTFGTLELARGVQQWAPAIETVVPALRWTELLPRAHEGGSREPSFLYRHLTLVEPVPDGICVLFDDVVTSGAHVQACAARLRDDTGLNISLCLSAGRATRDAPPDPFIVPDSVLPDVDCHEALAFF